MARLQKTLVDYVIIAITPALIMVLVGSLVHFLIEVLYGGGFEGRLNYAFSLFVFAAVLIARIAIEEGRERSVLFAIPLMLATLLVMGKFVEFRGPMASFSVLINIGLLTLVLWCADRLTWDCTVIDEREDASGEGLLQTVGLDRQAANTPDPEEAAARAARETAIPQDLEATSSDQEEPTPEPEYWWEGVWQRFLDRRNRPHAPGVWVIYFSLAALPLFGIGQRFIPETDVEARQHAFRLLYYYVGSGLGLLMTTSFLGIRRYLRQRRLDMPLEMTGVWLTVGSIMIVVLLMACAVLPRPSAEYSVTNVDFQLGAPDDLTASRYGTGSEGAEDKEQHAKNAASSDQDDPNARSGPSESEGAEGQGAEGEGGGSSGQEESGGQGEGSQSSAGSESSGGSQQESGGDKGGSKGDAKRQSKGGGSQSGGQSGGGEGDGQSGESSEGGENDGQSGEGSEDGGESSSDSQDETNRDQQSSSEPKEPNESNKQKPKPGGSGSGSSNSQSESQASQDQQERSGSSGGSDSAPSPSFSPSSMFSGLLSGIFKFLYYLFFIVLVGYLIWRYRTQVWEALTNFIQAIRDFWANLFGGGGATDEEAAEEAAAAATPPRPFADYEDPFASGAAARYTPQQLLAYSFEALQAWGREHDCPRDIEQTPHEYAGHLAMQRSSVGREARNLAEMYCFEAYSGSTLPREQVEGLRKLWDVLRREQASDFATVAGDG